MFSEDNYLGTEGGQARPGPSAAGLAAEAELYRAAMTFPFKWEREQNSEVVQNANEQ